MGWLLKRTPLDPTDALTRRIYENIAKTPGQQPNWVRAGWPQKVEENQSLFGLEYWGMFQRGELSEQETPATWAVLMRAVDTSEAVRMLLAVTEIDTEGQHWQIGTAPMRSAALNLHVYCKTTYPHLNGYVSPQRISKVRGQFLPKLRAVANQPRPVVAAIVMSPIDAELFLVACETAARAQLERQAENGR